MDDPASQQLIWGMPLWACWICIGVLLIMTGMFSASENAFTNCNKYHFRAEAEKGKRYAKVITYLVDHFDNTLVTVLVSSNTVATIMSFLSAMIWLQISTVNHWGNGVEALISTVVMGFLFYVISDTIPKVISKAIPDQMAIVMCYPLVTLQFLLFPIILVFRGLLKMIHHLFHLKDQNLLSKEKILLTASQAVNDETIIEEGTGAPEKLFEADETKLMNNVLTFDTRTVRQVFTPLDKAFEINKDGLTTESLNQAIQETEYSRIPVFEERRDNIIGILVIKTYFEEYIKDRHLSIPSILEEVVYIDVNENLDDAFDHLNREKVHLGVVRDQDKTIGIISMDDILEELVDDLGEEEQRVPLREAIQHE